MVSGLQGSACRFPGRRLQGWGIKAGFVELYSLVAGCKAALDPLDSRLPSKNSLSRQVRPRSMVDVLAYVLQHVARVKGLGFTVGVSNSHDHVYSYTNTNTHHPTHGRVKLHNPKSKH